MKVGAVAAVGGGGGGGVGGVASPTMLVACSVVHGETAKVR